MEIIDNDGGPSAPLVRQQGLPWFNAARNFRAANSRHERIVTMLYTIAIVLLILWLLGLVSSYTLGGFLHILLVIALVVILVEFIGGRRSP